MTTDKLKQVIEQENERLERDTVNQARDIIAAIGKAQRAIVQNQENIRELQAQLKKLEITQIDPISILGA